MYSTGQDLINAVRRDTSERSTEYVTNEEILGWISDFFVMYVAPIAGAMKRTKNFVLTVGSRAVALDGNPSRSVPVGGTVLDLHETVVFVELAIYTDSAGNKEKLKLAGFDQIIVHGLNSEQTGPIMYCVRNGVLYYSPLAEGGDQIDLYYEAYITAITATTELTEIPPLYYTTAVKFAAAQLWRKHKQISMAREFDALVALGIESMNNIRDREHRDNPTQSRGLGPVNETDYNEVPESIKRLM